MASIVMQSKFDGGKCQTCDMPMPKGTQIVWDRARGARHLTAQACIAAVEAGVVARQTPVVVDVPARVTAGTVVNFLTAAKNRGLKSPKVRFLAPGNGELRLSLAGGNTNYPGAVQVKVNGLWVGRIEADGRLTPGLSSNPDMVATLTAIANDPAAAAVAYGRLMSKCSFCNALLSDDRSGSSVDVGYGPDCAKRYGLPHAPKGKTRVLKAVPAAVPDEGFDDYGAAQGGDMDIAAAMRILSGRQVAA